MAQLTGWITTEHIWLLVGFAGQGLFAARFLVQWFKSEIEGRSVIPVAFWYFSIGGGIITLFYAIHVGKDAAPFILSARRAGGVCAQSLPDLPRTLPVAPRRSQGRRDVIEAPKL